MARYRTSVSTPLSPDEAFAFMADVTRFTEWDPNVKTSRRVAGDGPGLGASYDLDVGSTVMRYVVTHYSAPKRMVIEARTTFLTSIDEVTVEPNGAGSVVTYDAVLKLNGPLALFDLALAIAFRRLGDAAAAGLRRVLAAPK